MDGGQIRIAEKKEPKSFNLLKLFADLPVFCQVYLGQPIGNIVPAVSGRLRCNVAISQARPARFQECRLDVNKEIATKVFVYK